MSEAAEDDEVRECQKRVGTTLGKSDPQSGGHWRIDALIGIGGMAAVYAATHTSGQRHAIKILHPHIAISKELRARFQQEAQAIAALQHPSTVQVIAIDSTPEGAPFMVMELLDGESLGQLAFRLGRVQPHELCGYMDALLDVLIAAHARGIVHRDIKPDNLFVTREGRLKVLDFGIARMKEGTSSVRTRTGAMLGTTSYMAPEQVHARPIDGRADVFAVGATMFRILAKRRVHEAETDAELLIKMGSVPAPSIASVAPDVDPRLARVVDRALAFERDQRYPDAATMRADIAAVSRGENPPFAGAPAVSPPLDPTVAKSPRAGMAFAAAAPMAGAFALEPTVASVHGSPTPAPASVRISAAIPTSDAQVSSASAVRWGAGGAPQAPPSSPSRERERKTPMAVVVGVGALMLLGGGIIVASFMLGDCGASKRTAQAQDERDDDDRRPKKSPGASTAKSSGKPGADPNAEPGVDRGAVPDDSAADEEDEPRKGKGKKKKHKGKGRGRGHGPPDEGPPDHGPPDRGPPPDEQPSD